MYFTLQIYLLRLCVCNCDKIFDIYNFRNRAWQKFFISIFSSAVMCQCVDPCLCVWGTCSAFYHFMVAVVIRVLLSEAPCIFIRAQGRKWPKLQFLYHFIILTYTIAQCSSCSCALDLHWITVERKHCTKFLFICYTH
jgi:hypothetical protein